MAIQATPIPSLTSSTPQATGVPSLDQSREVRALRKCRDREFARLATLPGRDRHSLTRKLIRSPSMHRLYAFEGLRKAGQLANATPALVATVADQCNPLQPCKERSTSHYVGYGHRRRLVEEFGPAKRGRQMMVADLLQHLHPPLNEQFLFRGGMPAAFRAVEAAYADGFTFAVEADIVGFYGNVRHDGLADILRPLPSSVVDHVVWDRATGHGTVVDDTLPTSLQVAYPPPGAQTGLALGSACSPRVGERLIARLIAPAADCRTIAYADNILVVGRSREAVRACVQAMQLRAATSGGWASGLRLQDDGVMEIADPSFAFLHHEAQVRDGRFAWSPDQRKLMEFMAAHQDGDSPAGFLSLDAIFRAERKISHWRRAYPNWPAGEMWEMRELAALAARRYYLAATPLNRTRAATALVASFFAHGRRRSFEELTPTGTTMKADRRRETLINDAVTKVGEIALMNGFGLEIVGLRQ